MVGARISHLGEQGDFPEISPGFGHFVVGFQLAPADVAGKGVVGQGFFQHVLIVEQSSGNGVRQDGIQFLLSFQGQERAEGEHGILQGTFVVGQGRFGIQHVQLQLEQVVFR